MAPRGLARSYPKLLLHSDLHLEHGTFTLPAPPDAAIAAFLGDVHPGVESVARVRALSALPTLLVPGNHEFWGSDYFEMREQLRAAGRDQSVHVLDNDVAVIDGIRFVGTTLWSDYCGGNNVLMRYGLWNMRDHRHIEAARWWTHENKERFLQAFGHQGIEQYEGKFNPLLQMELHAQARRFLADVARQDFAGPTVVLTHHAPSQESLVRAGIAREALNPGAWVLRRDDTWDLTRVGSYASPLLESGVLWSDGKTSVDVDELRAVLWAHAHLHTRMEYGWEGMRVLCNPRGRVRRPHTRESADELRFYFSVYLSDEQLAADQRRYAENPEAGDVPGYQKDCAVDLAASGYAWVQERHLALLGNLDAMLAELKTLRPLTRARTSPQAHLAALRADTLRARVLTATKAFMSYMLAQTTSQATEHDLDWQLYNAGLARLHQHILMENAASYEDSHRLAASHPPDDQGRQFWTCPTPAKHVALVTKEVRNLRAVLAQVPQACEALRDEFWKWHVRRH